MDKSVLRYETHYAVDEPFRSKCLQQQRDMLLMCEVSETMSVIFTETGVWHVILSLADVHMTLDKKSVVAVEHHGNLSDTNTTVN